MTLLLIKARKCPACGKMGKYGPNCVMCGYVDPEWEKWVEKETKNILKTNES